MKFIYALFLLMLSLPSLANNSGVTFTVSDVKQGSTSGTISFQMDSCEGCMMNGWQYAFLIDHTPITGGSPGNPAMTFTNDSLASCNTVITSFSKTNQYLQPVIEVGNEVKCSANPYTTHIQVNDLKMTNGQWEGGDLKCNVTLTGNPGFDCGTIYVPALAPTPTPDVITQLNTAYNAEPTNCGDDTQPALLCSGVLIRGTEPSDSYHSWDPSPASVTSGGTSFSYLRKDSKYDKLAYGYTNGLIFFPQQQAPAGKLAIPTLCAFPIDAATDNRADKGCGEYTGHPESGTCQSQGILTAEQWHQHYVQYNSQHASECGFDLRTSATGSTISSAFNETIGSMATIATESFGTQNELRLQTWATGIPTELPIQAFFYLKGSSGLAGAQHDQQDFYNTTSGLVVPVVGISLPETTSDNVVFSYSASDQVVSSTHK
ncbi:hypothetical protein [Rahnella sikkimica]|uniref:Uncharacterized protein n=1 Tax=Rahnella sikkimica TaxID=1805933 RepID=A0A2L1UP40_9GAMM|nr:hypothetical protein [Rahnella sikkimica]AVF34685.1 hypothetical protein BV494_06950 [Rahnella sikkimica]